eukprot:8556409-Prorocentrum_lima.AAC.1
MRALQVPEKLITMVKALYQYPTFRVSIQGNTSDLHRQEAGIRQGCPLSPYLFLIIMTVLLDQVHGNLDPTLDLLLPRACFSEVLFADDTICCGGNAEALQALLHQIQNS